MAELYKTDTKQYVKVNLYGKLELVVELSNELIMCQRFAHLHNANDGGVDLVLTVLKHSLSSTHVFFLLLTHTDTRHVYTDSKLDTNVKVRYPRDT